jgi:Zn-finger nucleic acid-binding protein
VLCPVCKIPAIVIEYDKIELDYCTRCRGVWFDAGELELLLASAGLGGHEAFLESVMKSMAASSEKKRRCPICNIKMNKAYADKEARTLVDICREGHGIWFDGGELERLLGSLAAETPGQAAAYRKLVDFFGKMFKAPAAGSP